MYINRLLNVMITDYRLYTSCLGFAAVLFGHIMAVFSTKSGPCDGRIWKKYQIRFNPNNTSYNQHMFSSYTTARSMQGSLAGGGGGKFH